MIMNIYMQKSAEKKNKSEENMTDTKIPNIIVKSV